MKVIQGHKSSCVIGYNLEIFQSDLIDLKNCGCLNIVECKHTTTSYFAFRYFVGTRQGQCPLVKINNL